MVKKKKEKNIKNGISVFKLSKKKKPYVTIIFFNTGVDCHFL